jgi:hypothetical protein
VGRGSRDIVIDVDGDGVPVGIDIDNFASEIVDLTKLEAEGPVFGLGRVGGTRESGWLASIGKTATRADAGAAREAGASCTASWMRNHSAGEWRKVQLPANALDYPLPYVLQRVDWVDRNRRERLTPGREQERCLRSETSWFPV